jgi:SAM-dependent methyltransferase
MLSPSSLKTVEHSAAAAAAAEFFDRAIRDLAGVRNVAGVRVLDFGCGSGRLVEQLVAARYDAHGCDIVLSPQPGNSRLKQIEQGPYRIPFPDASFDVVVSTTVLEHAKNPLDYTHELYRVLKPGGCAMHLFPAKWYLPSEPHIRVPLANFFYPSCPRWWFALWALLGVRNEFQAGLFWRETADVNHKYYGNSVIYLSTSQHAAISERVFGNCEWPMEYYVMHAPGRFAQLCRRLPFPKFWGLVSREFRMALMLQRK